MTTLLARNANITDNAANPSTRRKNAGAFAPDSVELIEKFVVVPDLSELLFVGLVLLQRPIRRGCNDEMNADISNP